MINLKTLSGQAMFSQNFSRWNKRIRGIICHNAGMPFNLGCVLEPILKVLFKNWVLLSKFRDMSVLLPNLVYFITILTSFFIAVVLESNKIFCCGSEV